MRHIVFAWEIGSGFGHLTSIAVLAQTYLARGDKVTAIVPKFSFGRAFLEPLGISVFELKAPVVPHRLFPVSINYTANLLRNGFWHGSGVDERLAKWKKILKQLRPNVLICDHAPSALLASSDAKYPRLAIGSGFSVPPLASPMPCVQSWFDLPASYLIEKDQLFLDAVNPQLNKIGLPALPNVASMFDGVAQYICVEPELDHYMSRSHGLYSGVLEFVAPNARNERMPLPDKPFVFIYMTSAGNRFLAPILSMLKERDVPVLAYIPDMNAESRSALPSASNIDYLSRMIDLSQLVNGCCLAITHGGTLSASRLLKLGLKLLICPQDLEKAVLASRLVERKLAYALNWFTEGVITHEFMNRLLSPQERPEGLSRVVEKYKNVSSHDAVSIIMEGGRQLNSTYSSNVKQRYA